MVSINLPICPSAAAAKSVTAPRTVPTLAAILPRLFRPIFETVPPEGTIDLKISPPNLVCREPIDHKRPLSHQDHLVTPVAS